MTLDLKSGTFIPGSNVILVWSGAPGEKSSDDELRIQAPSRTGSFTTSADDFGLQVSLSTAEGRIGIGHVPNYLSPEADECTVTFTKVDPSGVEGSLDCRGLAGGQDLAVDVAADFTATR
jgi:hypothetical protein